MFVASSSIQVHNRLSASFQLPIANFADNPG